jgi:hypothetical protein
MDLVSSQRFPHLHLWKKLWKILKIQALTPGRPRKIGPWLVPAGQECWRDLAFQGLDILQRQGPAAERVES